MTNETGTFEKDETTISQWISGNFTYRLVNKGAGQDVLEIFEHGIWREESVQCRWGVITKRIESLVEKLSCEQLRLSACGVAANANTRETIKNRIRRESPYWSASYSDVCDAVDREIALRDD